jgi:hydroxyacylglutathione hydrolase
VIEVDVIACLEDNYAYLVRDQETTLIVDPSEAEPVLLALQSRVPTAILATHHHHDHVGGIAELCARFPNVPVYGHRHDRERIPKLTHTLEDNDVFTLGSMRLRALHVPGHTLGALTYVVEGTPSLAFTGDTLFLAGCGRLFEGTPAQMWDSMLRLRALPEDTLLYCGHEYAVSNLRFVRALADSDAARAYETALLTRRGQGLPSVPGLLRAEKHVNLFLRADAAEIAAAVGLSNTTETAQVFSELRARKNTFRA